MNLNLNTNFLFASLIWGSVGVGYWIYGKRQKELIPMLGGIAMFAASFLVGSWFWMSLICISCMAGVYFVLRRGY